MRYVVARSGIRGQKRNLRHLQYRKAAGLWSMTGRRSLLPVPERIGVTFSQWPTPVRGGGARYRSFGSFLDSAPKGVFRLLYTSQGSSSSGMTNIRSTWLVKKKKKILFTSLLISIETKRLCSVFLYPQFLNAFFNRRVNIECSS